MLLKNFQIQMSAQYCRGCVAGIIAAMAIVKSEMYVDYEVLLKVDAERDAQRERAEEYEQTAKSVAPVSDELDIIWTYP